METIKLNPLAATDVEAFEAHKDEELAKYGKVGSTEHDTLTGALEEYAIRTERGKGYFWNDKFVIEVTNSDKFKVHKVRNCFVAFIYLGQTFNRERVSKNIVAMAVNGIVKSEGFAFGYIETMQRGTPSDDTLRASEFGLRLIFSAMNTLHTKFSRSNSEDDHINNQVAFVRICETANTFQSKRFQPEGGVEEDSSVADDDGLGTLVVEPSSEEEALAGERLLEIFRDGEFHDGPLKFPEVDLLSELSSKESSDSSDDGLGGMTDEEDSSSVVSDSGYSSASTVGFQRPDSPPSRTALAQDLEMEKEYAYRPNIVKKPRILMLPPMLPGLLGNVAFSKQQIQDPSFDKELALYSPEVRSYTTVTPQELNLPFADFVQFAETFGGPYGKWKLINDPAYGVYKEALLKNRECLTSRMNYLWALNKASMTVEQTDMERADVRALHCDQVTTTMLYSKTFDQDTAIHFLTAAAKKKMMSTDFMEPYLLPGTKLHREETAETRYALLLGLNKFSILVANGDI